MEAPMERMPIACVHCAKAKAKCDKKVPCSRCVSKQILCQSRPTRRSTNMAFRRNNSAKARPGSVHSSSPFNLSDLSQQNSGHPLIGSELDLDFFGLMNRGPPFGRQDLMNGGLQRESLPHLDYTQIFGSGPASYESEPQSCQIAFSESPPELSVSITPIEQDGPKLEDLMPNFDDWDQSTCDPIVTMGSEADLTTAYELADGLETMGSQDISNFPGQLLEKAPKEATSFSIGPVDLATTPQEQECHMDIDTGLVSTCQSTALEESDALLRSRESWPFFCCDRVAKSDVFPPKTAAFYVEGLARVLTAHDWQMPPSVQQGDGGLGVKGSLFGGQIPESTVGHSSDALHAVTETILNKACTTHCLGRDSMGCSSVLAQAKEDGRRIKLPPRDTMARFVQSYIRHHEPYYACASDLRHGSRPVLQSNVQASHLLMLMAMAQGAAFVPQSAARYLSSGLIEACRLFLFDSIEKDILLSRDPIILKSALLFTVASAWSGDNWHMDIAMGQRGMYTSMLIHARMLDGRERRLTPDELRSGSEKVWRKWKDLEERRRIAYSWVVVDQELSLFSDTAPQLDVANLQAPMPGPEHLWRATSANDWFSQYNNVAIDERVDGVSLRDLFTSFVEGDLSEGDIILTPLHLRLLLHPLQTLICQLRQFMNCLPDTGRRPMGTSMSRAATKARLEEISVLLRQWYVFAERHHESEGNACWTSKANLIMYHLISLNTRTSMRFIEQFARGEVQTGSARQASQWLQSHCLEDPLQVLVHCGQIFRLVKSIPPHLRPPWWSGAVYRAALIAWATSISSAGSGIPLDNNTETDKPFAADALRPDHDSVQHYLRYGEGAPMLSYSTGKLVAMSNPENILHYCISLLEDDLSTRATEGIMRKLRGLLESWRSPPYAIKT